MQSVAVIDYGASNLRSVVKAIEHVAEGKHNIIVTDREDLIYGADRIIFPGQGAIRQCMESLQEKKLDQVLRECLKSKPYLGLCLGLQALMDYSDEDDGMQGLGIIPGKVTRFPNGHKDPFGDQYKIPHMGWNSIEHDNNHALWKDISSGEMFYFTHSYYVDPVNCTDTVGKTNYVVTFTSAIARDNIFAVQFHPEKSQHAGLQLLTNFLNW
jgi:imidazole glycerol-phosphate synthase subunit HisH